MCNPWILPCPAIEDDEARVTKIKALLEQLPRAHKDTLIYLFTFLRLLSLYSEENRMSTLNLGVIFAPTILRKRVECVVRILDNYYNNNINNIIIK